MTRSKSESDSTSAVDFLPSRISLASMRVAVKSCKGCPLFHCGHAVFGEGAAKVKVMFIGEQPGDLEEKQGRPFVGPSGRLFDEALAAANIDRESTYVTNAVKHFKHEKRGTARIHKKPNDAEVRACYPWLEQEIEVVQPKLIVVLGATAAQALLGKQFRVTKQRGEVVESPLADVGTACVAG
jgi:DNA polymerase